MRERRLSTDRNHVQNRCDLLIQRICRARFNPFSLKSCGMTNECEYLVGPACTCGRLDCFPPDWRMPRLKLLEIRVLIFFPSDWSMLRLKLLEISAPIDPDANY